MNTRVKNLLIGAILVLFTANIFVFNFWLLGFDRLRPNSAKAASTATYTETWKAAQVAMTQVTDWGGNSTNLGSRYFLYNGTQPNWVSGRSGAGWMNCCWWWRWWWWWGCCWWRWWQWSNSSNTNENGGIDPHAFVTKWSVSGKLTQN